MKLRLFFAICVLAAGLSGTVLARAPNQTEAEVTRDQEELAIQRTSAQMSGASENEMVALDRMSLVLEVRSRIAAWRAEREMARKAGDKELAFRIERRIHTAKREILDIARADSRMSAARE